jgi:hypothetical protein
VSWAKRGCSATIRYTGAGTTVQLAGSFNAWKPAAMPKVGAAYETTLQPGVGLESGKRYAYKFVVDGEWRLDRAAAWRIPDGSCMNSGVLMPDCQAGPEIVAQPVEATATSVKARVRVLAAANLLRSLWASTSLMGSTNRLL